MRFECWIPTATDTHTEYAILIAFLLRWWVYRSAFYLEKKLCTSINCLGLIWHRNDKFFFFFFCGNICRIRQWSAEVKLFVQYMPIIVQQDATIYSLFVSVNRCICFGWTTSKMQVILGIIYHFVICSHFYRFNQIMLKPQIQLDPSYIPYNFQFH
jgi:hypothetical protein